MLRDEIIAVLKGSEAEFRAVGVSSIALFGSVARGEERSNSDLDVVVRLDDSAAAGLSWFRLMDSIRQKLEALAGRNVDLVAEPVRKESLRRAIERDRLVAFQ
jgi:predicted nucleotidyltransferase